MVFAAITMCRAESRGVMGGGIVFQCVGYFAAGETHFLELSLPALYRQTIRVAAATYNQPMIERSIIDWYAGESATVGVKSSLLCWPVSVSGILCHPRANVHVHDEKSVLCFGSLMPVLSICLQHEYVSRWLQVHGYKYSHGLTCTLASRYKTLGAGLN